MTNIKVVFLGESYVGKTSLINRYISDKFYEEVMSTWLALIQQKVSIIKIKNIFLIYGILQEDKISEL